MNQTSQNLFDRIVNVLEYAWVAAPGMVQKTSVTSVAFVFKKDGEWTIHYYEYPLVIGAPLFSISKNGLQADLNTTDAIVESKLRNLLHLLRTEYGNPLQAKMVTIDNFEARGMVLPPGVKSFIRPNEILSAVSELYHRMLESLRVANDYYGFTGRLATVNGVIVTTGQNRTYGKEFTFEFPAKDGVRSSTVNLYSTGFTFYSGEQRNIPDCEAMLVNLRVISKAVIESLTPSGISHLAS